MSVCAKYQLSSWSRSDWKVCVWVGWVGSRWVLCLTQRSCFWVALVELSWVELRWVLTISGLHVISYQGFSAQDKHPYINQKKILQIIGFMLFKTTSLNLGFQCKNQFGKICTESWDIGKNVSKYAGLVWWPGFWHILINISGPSAYFSKPIFALKPWAQASCFEYHEPYKRSAIIF